MVFGLLLASSFMLNAHCGGCSTDNKKVSAVIQSHVKKGDDVSGFKFKQITA